MHFSFIFRRIIMKKILILVLIILISIFLYGRYLEPHLLTSKEIAVASNKITPAFDGFKIIHFSDLLYGYNTKEKDITNLVAKINEYKPDMIIFTGNLVASNYSLSEKDQQFLIENLQKLDCTLYKYAIVGNNDEKILDLYHTILDQANFKMLNDAREYIFYHDTTPIKIIGLTNPDAINTLLVDEENIQPSYRILLTHNPDTINKIKVNDFDLILSGHNLGGIINVPFYGPLINKKTDYKNNYYAFAKTQMYISNGIGTENFTFRLFNRPSFNLYRFQKTEA